MGTHRQFEYRVISACTANKAECARFLTDQLQSLMQDGWTLYMHPKYFHGRMCQTLQRDTGGGPWTIYTCWMLHAPNVELLHDMIAEMGCDGWDPFMGWETSIDPGTKIEHVWQWMVRANPSEIVTPNT